MSRLNTLITAGLIACLAVAVSFWAVVNSDDDITDLPPVVDSTGTVIDDAYTSLEEVSLGGAKQWILIRSANTSLPVLLYLHGGPGGAVMPWVDLFHAPLLEENFIVVHWDQRGAGKSYNRDLSAADITPEKLISDTLELTGLLRERFGQEKIFLTGQSWGSALGFLTIAQDSAPYHAFIPTSERVAWHRSLEMGFEWAKAQAEENDDADILERLTAIEPFDALDEADLVVQREVIDHYRGGDYYTPGLWDEYLAYALEGKSPYYTKREIQEYVPGLELSSAGIERPGFLGGYNLFESHTKASIPVHFIHGDHDYNTPADLAFEYYQFLEAPDKSFTRIENAAHMVLYDQPQVWTEALISIKTRVLAE